MSAYDDTITPIIKGKSHGPPQFGRKPGLLSEPTVGFSFATYLPAGNPDDASSVEPLIARTQVAIDRMTSSRQLAMHSVGGDRGLNDAKVRQALHERGMLSVGMAKNVEPTNPTPDPETTAAILAASGLTRQRTAYQVELASACGSSRPVVESHIATLLCRGVGHLRYRGPHGARVQLGMTVMAHNGAALVRVSQQQLSDRAKTLRRKLWTIEGTIEGGLSWLVGATIACSFIRAICAPHSGTRGGPCYDPASLVVLEVAAKVDQ